MTILKLKHKDLKDGNPTYLLFCGSNFYPNGGWDDFKGYFSSLENAKLWLQKNEPDAKNMWAHVVYNHRIVAWANATPNQRFIENGIWLWRLEE